MGPPLDPLGPIAFSPGTEEWIEFGPVGHRRRVGFHDYAALYAVPGLYERVFYEELGMCSAQVVVRTLGEALRGRGVHPAASRALDFGAGNGIGGAELRELGFGSVVGLDLEPEARVAARRDRPGVYEDYLVTDVDLLADSELAALRARGFDALVAVAALGFGHVPARALERAVGLVRPGGWAAFALSTRLVPGQADDEGERTGYPALLDALLTRGGAEQVLARSYSHRRQTDGSDHPARAIVLRLAP